MKPTVYEEGDERDVRRLNQRMKQLAFGINSPEYRQLIKLCPKWESDPLMPDPKWKCSKRNWDSLIRRWRRQIHRISDIYRLYGGTTTSSSEQGRERDIRRLSYRWRQIRSKLLTHRYMFLRRNYPSWVILDPLMPDIRDKCNRAQWDTKMEVWRMQTHSIYYECFRSDSRKLLNINRQHVNLGMYLRQLRELKVS
jgi:hypothetical protein